MHWIFSTLTLALLVSHTPVTLAGKAAPKQQDLIRYAADSIIIKFKSNTAGIQMRHSLKTQGIEVERVLIPSLSIYLAKIRSRLTVTQAIETLKKNPHVEYTQADHEVKLRSTTKETRPNDPLFSSLWNMEDIHAPRAWETSKGGKDASGNDIVVALVDDGMDLSHPDLAPNLWSNKNEVPGNQMDDDGNGYVDDVNGWNAYEGDGRIPTSAMHGTHVGGIAGSKGNNGKFTAGVNWNIKLMAVAGASGKTSTIAAAYGYVIEQKKLWLQTRGEKGANIVATNSSFGVDYGNCNSGEFPIWNNLYEEMGKLGVLSAAATINADIDVDQEGDVPTGCSSEYIVTVTRTQRDGTRGPAGYGRTTIDLGAPGDQVLSTVPDQATSRLSGTSMSTPHVTGAIGFLHAVAGKPFNSFYLSHPAEAALKIKQALLSSVELTPALNGVTVSGGRLRLDRAAEKVR